jgi:hypothetical protein
MRRSIPPACVARRLNSLLFALLAPCHACASTPENVNLFLREPLELPLFLPIRFRLLREDHLATETQVISV